MKDSSFSYKSNDLFHFTRALLRFDSKSRQARALDPKPYQEPKLGSELEFSKSGRKPQIQNTSRVWKPCVSGASEAEMDDLEKKMGNLEYQSRRFVWNACLECENWNTGINNGTRNGIMEHGRWYDDNRGLLEYFLGKHRTAFTWINSQNFGSWWKVSEMQSHLNFAA